MASDAEISEANTGSLSHRVELLMLLASLRRYSLIFLLGPACVAILTFIVIDNMPRDYVSEATIDLSIDGIGSSFPELEGWKNSVSRRTQRVFESPEVISAAARSKGIEPATVRVKTRLEPNSRRISIKVTASTASRAKLLGEALLKAAISANRPRDEERKHLEDDLERIENNLLLFETAYLKLRESLPRSSDPQELATMAAALIQVAGYKAALERQRTITGIRLTGIPEAAVVMHPTLATQPTEPRRVLWSMIAALGALSLLISGVLLQRVWLELRSSKGSDNCPTVTPQNHASDSRAPE